MNYQGAKNEGPHHNVGRLKYWSSSLTEIGFGTTQPQDGDSYSEEWGEQVFNSETNGKISYQEYCKLNSCTDDGPQAITEYNDLPELWEKKKNSLVLPRPWQRNALSQ